VDASLLKPLDASLLQPVDASQLASCHDHDDHVPRHHRNHPKPGTDELCCCVCRLNCAASCCSTTPLAQPVHV
jgi:hypothetical protein